MEPHIMIKTVSQFLLNTFSKNCSRPTIYTQKSIIRTIRKKLGKDAKQNYNAAFSHCSLFFLHCKTNVFTETVEITKGT